MAALESQELRIDRLDKLIVVTVENQTATLRLLQKIDARVQGHSAVLKEHTAILEEHSVVLKEHSVVLKEHSVVLKEHSAILREHTAILREHSARLGNLENLGSRIVEELVAIKDILASPKGMGFTPEPENKD